MSNADGKNYFVVAVKTKTQYNKVWLVSVAVSAVAVIAAGITFGIKLAKTKKN